MISIERESRGWWGRLRHHPIWDLILTPSTKNRLELRSSRIMFDAHKAERATRLEFVTCGTHKAHLVLLINEELRAVFQRRLLRSR